MSRKYQKTIFQKYLIKNTRRADKPKPSSSDEEVVSRVRRHTRQYSPSPETIRTAVGNIDMEEIQGLENVLDDLKVGENKTESKN